MGMTQEEIQKYNEKIDGLTQAEAENLYIENEELSDKLHKEFLSKGLTFVKAKQIRQEIRILCQKNNLIAKSNKVSLDIIDRNF